MINNKEAGDKLRELYPGIKLLWSKPSDDEWHEDVSIGLRLDFRYKGQDGGMVFTEELLRYPDEALKVCLEQMARLIKQD